MDTIESLKEFENKNVDEIDLKYLNEIEKAPGIRQFELAKKLGEYDTKVHYRLLELERIRLVKLVRGRRSLKCYIGPYFSEYAKISSSSGIMEEAFYNDA
jgi:DNA-binding IclR family transcriptional regulator